MAAPFNEPRKLPSVSWHSAPDGCQEELTLPGGKVRLKYGVLVGGRGDRVQVVQIDTGPMQVTVLPTRGMSVWQLICDAVPFQWHSPIDGPVHPSLVPVDEPSGLGWLEGFDELIVRCGMVSNGAPDFDPQSNRLTYPLHGRVGNLPADRVETSTDGELGVLTGWVNEKRLFFNNLQLSARIKVAPGGRELQIEDTITNLSAQQAESQMLYHINVGSPVLKQDAQMMVPFDELAPRNAHAATSVASWDRFLGPTLGFEEQVYFFRPNSDARGNTAVMLADNQRNQGLGVSYDTHTLPYFVLWKNTAANEDGYVAGLEPTTNFPNPRSFEGKHQRLTVIPPGESVTHRVNVHPLVGREAVAEFSQRVESLKRDGGKVHDQAKPDWSV